MKKVTDLEKFSLEHVWRPFLTLVMEEQRLNSPPMSLDDTAAKLREDTVWSRHVLSRIRAIGFYIPAYINHPLADIVRGLKKRIESGANAAANSPAPEVSEASPTRTDNTTEIGHD